jgi:hypothetical protein
MTLDLTATGGTVAGSFKRNDQTLPITNGKISEGKFTFNVSLNGKTQQFTGEHRGDEVRLWMNSQGAASAAILHRTKDATSIARYAGRWQGVTPSGRQLELSLEPDGTGSITLAQKPANITESKVEGDALTFTAGALEGRPVLATARLVGAELELIVEGVGTPITLERFK